jgi:flagellar protein FlgJ
MGAPIASQSVTDFSQFAKLRAGAQAQSPEALKQAAKQFEAMFTQELLKASHSDDQSGDLLGGSDNNVYRDLYDQQMALHLSSGRGLGIAEMLVKQLQGHPTAAATPAAGADAATTPAPVLKLATSVALPGLTAEPIAVPKNADDFVDAVQPHAERAASALGIPAKVLVAQAALETGWGKHQIKNADGCASHNYFGIKADASWTGARATVTTTEYTNGKPHTETAQFRSYGSAAEAFDDYATFVKSNPRYADALRHGGNAEHYVQGLQKAGYATDPAYARKISNIAYGRTMKIAMADPASSATRIA